MDTEAGRAEVGAGQLAQPAQACAGCCWMLIMGTPHMHRGDDPLQQASDRIKAHQLSRFCAVKQAIYMQHPSCVYGDLLVKGARSACAPPCARQSPHLQT